MWFFVTLIVFVIIVNDYILIGFLQKV